MIVPELCPDDGLQSQLPEHATAAMSKPVYLPASHSRHAFMPVVAEYFPALQSTQVAALDEPTAAEYFPRPHPTHVADDVAPTALEYLPDSQFTHCGPLT